MKPLFLISDSNQHELPKLRKFVLPPCHIKTLKIATPLKSVLNKRKPAIFILNSTFSKQKIKQYASSVIAVSPNTRIILLIHQNEISLGKESIKWGIYAYIITPFHDIDLVKQIIKNALCEWEFLQKTSELLSLVKKKDIKRKEKPHRICKGSLANKETLEINVPRTINTNACSPLEIRDIITDVKVKMSQLFDYSVLLILVLAETKPTLYILRNYDVDSHFINQAVHNVFKIFSATSGKGISIKDIEQIIENNVTNDTSAKTKPESIQSAITLPLVANSEDFGYASMVSHEPDAFDADAIQQFFPVCYSLAIALRNARLFQSTKELSITDSLTRIYNRHYFDDAVEKEFLRAHRYKHPLSIALIDIDNFKAINDTYGHPEGDKVLRHFANRVTETIRNTDILARYGGEEFSIIMPLTDIEEGIIVMERLRVIIAGSLFPITRHDIQLTVSIGLSSLFGHHITAAKKLIREADSAMYLAKKTGKNRVCIYTSGETKTKNTAAIPIEKRGLRRVKVHFPLKYIVLPKINEDHESGITKDISINGLCFETDNRIKPGTYAMIEFKVSLKKTTTKKVKMLYQVVWAMKRITNSLLEQSLFQAATRLWTS
ncbi:MAG: sensor domain-containing diguanylate cyclase [Candidatus Brocadiales bacterium]|nr:sensor domain-containing diguanylate cyclase [Candidatus Brocadiales bacterium]